MAFVWFYYETKTEKPFTWILIPLQLWPHYKLLRLVLESFTRKTNFEQKKSALARRMGGIEVFLESIPQTILLSLVLPVAFGVAVGLVGQDENYASLTVGNNKTFFLFKYAFSFISASLGVTNFFLVGPLKFLSSMDLQWAITLLTTIFFILWRVLSIVVIMRNLGIVLPLSLIHI